MYCTRFGKEWNRLSKMDTELFEAQCEEYGVRLSGVCARCAGVSELMKNGGRSETLAHIAK